MGVLSRFEGREPAHGRHLADEVIALVFAVFDDLRERVRIELDPVPLDN